MAIDCCALLDKATQPSFPLQEQKDLPEVDATSDDCSLREAGPCEACPYCQDTCTDDTCRMCLNKPTLEVTPTCPNTGECEPIFTICQVRRHCTEKSLWIVAGKDIYDVTAYIEHHPGGKQSLLRKGGGAEDCSEDFKFHSKAGKRAWKKYKIGTLVPCPQQNNTESGERPWWQFWGN